MREENRYLLYFRVLYNYPNQIILWCEHLLNEDSIINILFNLMSYQHNMLLRIFNNYKKWEISVKINIHDISFLGI